MGSPDLGFDTSSSVSLILGDAKSSPTTSPECRSTRTLLPSLTASMGNDAGHPGHGGKDEMILAVLEASISSQEDSPARMSPSLAAVQDSQESDRDSSTSSPESLSLFDPAGFSSRMFPVSSLRTAVGTSEQSLERWPTSGTAWPGGFSTHATSECRSDEGGCSSSEPSLTEILEEPQNVAGKYSLSARAASGILRRAVKRGRTLPQHLERALAEVAGTTPTPTGGGTHPSRASGTVGRMTTTRRQDSS